MRTHPHELLAQSLDEDIGLVRQRELESHLAECAACRELARDLHDSEERLGAREPATALPPLDLAARRHGAGAAPLAAAAVGVFALIVVGAAVLSGRVTFPVSASPTASASLVGLSPRLLLAHRAVIDVGPGGTPTVVTQAFDAFSILSPDGRAANYPISGVAIGTPKYDGQGHIAYWARAGVGTAEYRLAVWEAATNQERTLLTLRNETPGGDPTWTSDTRALIVAIKAPAGDQVRLLRVNTDGTGSAVISDAAPGVGVVYADDAVIVGIRGGNYVVLDARGGQTIRAKLRQPVASDLGANQGGVVWELVRPFESESGPLRIWRASDPTVTLASVDHRGVETPVFWPGRSEVVFARGTGVYAVDYNTGASRELLSLPEAPRLVGFDPTGSVLVVRHGTSFLTFERSGDGLRPRTDLQFAAISTDVYEPMGVIGE
jgi:hypothetical protein